MNKIIYYCVFIAVISGCSDFAKINTNRQGVTEEMANRDRVSSGGLIQLLQRQVVPVGTAANKTDIINAYQRAYHLGPDTWSGYFGQNADWNGGKNHTTYSLNNEWIKWTYEESYKKVFSSWLSIKNNFKDENSEVYALAQILKISAWQKTTDCFGPIPYTNAGKGMFITPYDPQDVVYKTMMEDLDKAIKVLAKYGETNGSIYANYDLIYGGDCHKWIKYANSLLLRMAVRIRYADENTARTYAEKAVTNPFGVMTDKEDGASISSAQGLQFENPIERFAGQYAECRMGTPAFSYLVGYQDPRLPKYYMPSSGKYAIAVPFLSAKYLPIPVGAGVKSEDFKTCSLPNIERNTPVHWMKTSEVFFLKAECALLGWNMGSDAETLYKEGIAMSFAENGINPSLAEEYANRELTPSYVNLSSLPKAGHKYSPATSATVKFEGTPEQKLEKIIIQKWIAIYPDGQEAWSEWRRTGYPKLQPVMRNTSNGIVNTDKGIRRMNYPSATGKTQEEQQVYDEAVSFLNGPDTPATRLWWDNK